MVSSVYSQDNCVIRYHKQYITIGQCGNLQLGVTNNSKPSLMYSDLHLIEGTMVDFICPPGLILNGTMSVTCTGNGEWEPEPQDVSCIEG